METFALTTLGILVIVGILCGAMWAAEEEAERERVD
jgi:hypothetical protein